MTSKRLISLRMYQRSLQLQANLVYRRGVPGLKGPRNRLLGFLRAHCLWPLVARIELTFPKKTARS